MVRRSGAALLFLFFFVQIAVQCAGLSAASASSNFYWKSTYSRPVGTTPSTSASAACPSGTERSSVLSSTYATNSPRPGAYLCFQVCKAGFKGAGSVCYLSPAPTGYVSCGAGIAASTTLCGSIITNQLVASASLGLAAFSLASTESSVGEDVADVINIGKSEIKALVKSPKLYEETKTIAKAMLPTAKASETLMRTELKKVADGIEDAPTFLQKVRANLASQGFDAARLKQITLAFKKGLLASKVSIRVGSIVYNALYDNNTDTIDYLRDSTALILLAFSFYEITHPEDKIPASTIFGAMAAFMYPTYAS